MKIITTFGGYLKFLTKAKNTYRLRSRRFRRVRKQGLLTTKKCSRKTRSARHGMN